MENTIENKTKLFLVYALHKTDFIMKKFDPKVWKEQQPKALFLLTQYPNIVFRNAKLELRRIESITEEELKLFYIQALDEKIPYKNVGDFLGQMESFGFFTSHEADILRDLGIAIEYAGLSVEKMIEYGWIKLMD